MLKLPDGPDKTSNVHYSVCGLYSTPYYTLVIHLFASRTCHFNLAEFHDACARIVRFFCLHDETRATTDSHSKSVCRLLFRVSECGPTGFRCAEQPIRIASYVPYIYKASEASLVPKCFRSS